MSPLLLVLLWAQIVHRLLAVHAAGLVRSDGHGLETILHVVVVEVLGVEALDGRFGFEPADTLEPAVECLKSHDTVDQHEGGRHGGEAVAHLPGDEVDELEEVGQADFDPEDAQGSPHAHEWGGGAPAEDYRHDVWDAAAGNELGRVAPGNRAERSLHPPTHCCLKASADQGAYQEDDKPVALVEAVERHGKNNGAESVDGGEGAKQQTGSVLIDARIDPGHVEDDLDDEAEHAADHEHPEQVEEVELNVALARGVTAQHAFLRRPALFHGAELFLELALLFQHGVDRRCQRDEDGELDEGACKLQADALEHHVDEYLAQSHHDEDIAPPCRIASVTLDERPAEQDERNG